MSVISSRFLLLAALSTAHSSIETGLATSVGYRKDTLTERYNNSGIDQRVRFDSIHSIAFEIDGLISFNQGAYLRAMGQIAEAPGHLRKKTYTDGTLDSTTRGGKSHAQSWLGAAGWQFNIAKNCYSLCLEAGGMTHAIWYNHNTKHRLKLYTPFVGMLLHIPLGYRWYFEADLDYTFAGSRYESVEGIDFHKGSFQGPFGGAAIGANIGKQCALAITWKTLYLFTNHLSIQSIDNERTKWQMQQFSLQFSYRF